MSASRPIVYNLDSPEGATAGGLKDILPGDQVNNRAAMNAAYSKMGENLAQTVADEQAYKEPMSDINQLDRNDPILSTSYPMNSEKHSLALFAYIVAHLLLVFTWPIPGTKHKVKLGYVILVIIALAVSAVAYQYLSSSYWENLINKLETRFSNG